MGCGPSSAKAADVPVPPKRATIAEPEIEEEEEPAAASPAIRSSVYQSRELPSERFSRDLRPSAKSAVFDTNLIGTATRHGIAPVRGGGGAKAKINQDRGLVCHPFNGSMS